jgi:hypothetical protein
MSSEKININLSLNLSDEELNQFYWNLYGTSLIGFAKCPDSKEGYEQLIKQIESFFIQQDADNIFKLEEVKTKIKKLLQFRSENN